MRRLIIYISAMLVTLAAGAKPVTSRIRIANAQSKSKIENTIKRVPGVTTATYDPTTKMLSVTYDNKKTNTSKIRAAVQKSGYQIGKNPIQNLDAPYVRKAK